MTSGLARLPDMHRLSRQVRFVPIVLQKSFYSDARKFLEPLMRFTSGDVRGPYRFIQNRSRAPAVALKAIQQQRSRQINFREIFRVVRFSTFATISANSGQSR